MKPRTTILLLLVLSLIGLADSIYLTWDHYAHLADPASFGGGLCGTDSACDISRTSAASEIPLGGLGPGLPISILAIGFYIAFLVLTALRSRNPDDPAPRRIQLGLSLLASLYSIALLVLSLTAQGALCTFCTVLYVANVGLLVACVVSLEESLVTWLKQVWGSIPKASTGAAAFAFFATVAGFYVIYATQLQAAQANRVVAGPTTTIEVGDRPTKGSPDAPVHIVEFADIQCPHCALLFDTLNEVVAERPDDVKVTFVHFPLDKACNRLLARDFHPDACWLALLADCARPQGRFWEVLGALFKLPSDNARQAAFDVVKGMGVEMTQLRKCMEDPASFARLEQDVELGIAQEITGTPVFFVNGHKLSGARDRAFIDNLIDEAIAPPPASGAR